MTPCENMSLEFKPSEGEQVCGHHDSVFDMWGCALQDVDDPAN